MLPSSVRIDTSGGGVNCSTQFNHRNKPLCFNEVWTGCYPSIYHICYVIG